MQVQELDPKNTWASVSIRRLEPVVKERHEKLKVGGESSMRMIPANVVMLHNS